MTNKEKELLLGLDKRVQEMTNEIRNLTQIILKVPGYDPRQEFKNIESVLVDNSENGQEKNISNLDFETKSS